MQIRIAPSHFNSEAEDMQQYLETHGHDVDDFLEPHAVVMTRSTSASGHFMAGMAVASDVPVLMHGQADAKHETLFDGRVKVCKTLNGLLETLTEMEKVHARET